MISAFCIIVPLWLLIRFQTADSQTCTFPAQWNSVWYDSSSPNGEITITTDTITGWSIQTYTATSTTWTCKYEDTTNNYLVFEGDQTTFQAGNHVYTYMCIRWTEITAYSYYFYRMSNVEAQSQNTRVTISAGQTTSNFASVCGGSPTSPEFFTMVKQGFTSTAKQNCPDPFLGTFSYDYNDGSTTTTCSDWDVCADRTTMTINSTGCGTVAYSSGGVVLCAATITDSSDSSIYYASVINEDSSVNGMSGTYRFTCFAVKTSGSNVVASEIKQSCESGQSPTARPTGGATITLTASVTCPFTTTSVTSATTTATTTTTTTTTIQTEAGGESPVAAAAAGATLGALAIIGGVVVVVVLIIKFKSPRKVGGASHDINANGIPPKEDTPSQPNTARDAVDIETPESRNLPPIVRDNSQPPADTTAPHPQPPLPPINSTST